MQIVDPRAWASRPAIRPILAVAAAGVLWVGWLALPEPGPPPLNPTQIAVLQHDAFTASEAQPGFTRPERVPVEVRAGETLESAVGRAGVAGDDARAAVESLSQMMDTAHVKAGLAFEAAIAHPRGHRGPARLVGLSLRTGPATALTLSRSFDGALRLRELDEKIKQETTVAAGAVEGSVYESAERLGATPAITAKVVTLFAHKLDFERDIHPGDGFTLVFGRRVTESGRLVEVGELDYAELHGVRFYRFERANGETGYFDEAGKNIKAFLLRTPVDGARVTSTFGLRRHPILGYNRAHQGVDFGAGAGTPILAAGDGVVQEARRWAGYGNWLRIRHGGGWDTGYGHVSRYAKGIRPGARVRQGQVVAYVGSTGMSTGPHLHYEVWRNGARVNPIGAKVPQSVVLAGAELDAFRNQANRIDGLIAAETGVPAKLAEITVRSAGLRR